MMPSRTMRKPWMRRSGGGPNKAGVHELDSELSLQICEGRNAIMFD